MSTLRTNEIKMLDDRGAGSFTFDSVADLKEASQLKVGQKVRTLGYYSPGDGGGNDYEIVAAGAGTDDGGSFIDLSGSGLQAKGLFGGEVNVRQFGAKGDGVNDDLPSIQAAVDSAPPSGAIISFPNGTYYTPKADVTDINSWVLVEKDNIKFVSENLHGATLENIIILARGSYGNKFKLGTSLVSGEKDVTTSVAHDFTKNSYVQLISGVSPYSTDAGEWQNGSVNPTFNTRPDALFMETHRVSYINSNTSFTLYDEVIFPVYNPDTTGQSVTVPGVDGAYVREVFPVRNFECVGLAFKREEGNSFRGVYLQRTLGGGMYKCLFLTNDGDDGRHIRTEESVDFTVEGCIEFRDPTGTSGSSWNSVIIGGGSSDIKIVNNSFYGGAQIIDITPALDYNILFGQPRDHGPDKLYFTVHSFYVSGNYFSGGGDAFTTHPGSYKLTLVDNTVETGSTGFRIRSRINTIVGNNIRTRRTGIACSAFYYNTLITGNTIKQIADPADGYWYGVRFSPMSSEVMNNNDVKNVLITGNVIDADRSGGVPHIIGIQFRHAGSGVPNNPNFTDFTSTIKTNISEYVIDGNTFYRCGVSMQRYINGVSVLNNHFKGDVNADHWIQGNSTDSVRHVVVGNYFYQSSDVSDIFLTDSVTESYPYNVANYVGRQYGILENLTMDVPEGYASVYGSQYEINDKLSINDKGSLQSIRGSGNAELNLHGTPLDGTSRSTVRINYESGTSDNRTYINSLLVQEGDVWAYPDNTHTLGIGSYRWKEVYAANGTINTSDEREKQQVRDLSEAEHDVAIALKGKIKVFRWNEAVEKKGEDARWHFGVMAQEVKSVFDSHGLDAHEYGLFCYDEWDTELDEEGKVLAEAGNRYGVRYEQLMAFIISAI